MDSSAGGCGAPLGARRGSGHGGAHPMSQVRRGQMERSGQGQMGGQVSVRWGGQVRVR